MGDGRSLRRPAGAGAPGGHPKTRAARAARKGTASRAPVGPGAGGGRRGNLREEGDGDGSLRGWRRRSPGTGCRGSGVGDRRPAGHLGSELRPGPGSREGPRGRGGLASETGSVFGGKPTGEQGKVTLSE